VIDNHTGFSDVLTKPFDPNKLLEKIARYTGGDIEAESTETAPSNAPGNQQRDTEPDFAGAESNFAQVAKQIKFCQMSVKNIKTCKQNYEKAINTQDHKLISDVMHKAKTMFVLLGLEHFY